MRRREQRSYRKICRVVAAADASPGPLGRRPVGFLSTLEVIFDPGTPQKFHGEMLDPILTLPAWTRQDALASTKSLHQQLPGTGGTRKSATTLPGPGGETKQTRRRAGSRKSRCDANDAFLQVYTSTERLSLLLPRIVHPSRSI